MHKRLLIYCKALGYAPVHEPGVSVIGTAQTARTGDRNGFAPPTGCVASGAGAGKTRFWNL